MLNDKEASELISKSLRYQLTEEEAKAVDECLNSSSESVAFSKISQAIQNSVSEVAGLSTAGELPSDLSLSGEAKRRIGDSIRRELDSGQIDSNATTTNTNSDADFGPSEHPSTGNLSTRAPGSSADSIDVSRNESFGGGNTNAETREVVGKFSLIRRLGEGGIGNVWLARDEQLRRNVAVKELNRHSLEQPKAWQRFHREAEITGHLEHPNVVPLYQFGFDRKSGEPFYAMRFVGKRTLADAIIEHHEKVSSGQDGRLGLHRLLSAFLDVCQAIAYAHSRGVIHRDLKPENVALDNFGQVIVLDWGLAKLDDSGELSSQLNKELNISESALAQTMDGEIIGTPLYMAPEQAAGDIDRVDERTDVYGLGAILFAILTGSAPHENSNRNIEPNEFKDVLKAIAENRSPEPGDYSENVPRELEAICSKAMSRKNFMRFESASALADSVERWMAGQSQQKPNYENLRMEGRELRADLLANVNDLETNVRFMSQLPPIEELISVREEDQVAIWRERLSTIYAGLLKAKPDYQAIAYVQVVDDQFSELVRVERHSTEASTIRNVPRSRLRTERVNNFLTSVINNKPEDVLTSLVSDPLSDHEPNCEESVRLVSAVPVFDPTTEEAFGVVLIDCDIAAVFERQLSRSKTMTEIVVGCDSSRIMMHKKSGSIVEASVTKAIADEAPYFARAAEHLSGNQEFIDSTDLEVFGARIWLVPNQHGLVYLLRRPGDD